jgi:hypothetical protein
MSVDYYACSCCGEALYDEFVGSCEKCGRSICSSCLANYDTLDVDAYIPSDVQNDDGEILAHHCPFCSGEIVDDGELVAFLLKKIGMSREDAIEEFKTSHNHNI